MRVSLNELGKELSFEDFKAQFSFAFLEVQEDKREAEMIKVWERETGKKHGDIRREDSEVVKVDKKRSRRRTS
jgi:hypothetical protein